jgi:hypothetical protein
MNTSNSNQNKVTRQARIDQMLAGVQKYFTNMPSILLGNTSYTPAHLVETLKEAQAATKRTSDSRAAWMTDVQTERNVLKQIEPLLRYIKAFVVAQFGDTQGSSNKLADFGLAPRKVRTKNAATKAEAALQSKSTRVARGTDKGKRQRAKIKGTPAPRPLTGGPVAKEPAAAASSAPAQVKAPS